VETEEPGLGTDARISARTSVDHGTSNTVGNESQSDTRAMPVQDWLVWFSAPFRGLKDRQVAPINSDNAVSGIADELLFSGRESSESSEAGGSFSSTHPVGTWAGRQTNFTLASTIESSPGCKTTSMDIQTDNKVRMQTEATSMLLIVLCILISLPNSWMDRCPLIWLFYL